MYGEKYSYILKIVVLSPINCWNLMLEHDGISKLNVVLSNINNHTVMHT